MPGIARTSESSAIKRAVYPQRFLFFIASLKAFEFIGWWNNWGMTQAILATTENFFRPIKLLRRKQTSS